MFEKAKNGDLIRLQICASNCISDDIAPVNRSRTGYGKKIPTSWRVRTIDNRWRRVYCAIYSNSGTLYVCHGSDRTIVNLP